METMRMAAEEVEDPEAVDQAEGGGATRATSDRIAAARFGQPWPQLRGDFSNRQDLSFRYPGDTMAITHHAPVHSSRHGITRELEDNIRMFSTPPPSPPSPSHAHNANDRASSAGDADLLHSDYQFEDANHARPPQRKRSAPGGLTAAERRATDALKRHIGSAAQPRREGQEEPPVPPDVVTDIKTVPLKGFEWCFLTRQETLEQVGDVPYCYMCKSAASEENTARAHIQAALDRASETDLRSFCELIHEVYRERIQFRGVPKPDWTIDTIRMHITRHSKSLKFISAHAVDTTDALLDQFISTARRIDETGATLPPDGNTAKAILLLLAARSRYMKDLEITRSIAKPRK